MVDRLADQLDDALPQTQCGLCGFKGCRPYAEAMAAGDADINRCPPGGADTIIELARLLQRPVLPLDETRGVTKPPAVALIDEAWCIGCTLCIQACPVDAIVGAAKRMHTVIAEECTGCELCIPPCPVDCITMVSVPRELTRERAWHARERYRARQVRLAMPAVAKPRATTPEDNKKNAALRALERARARISAR